jgi:MFS family permease
MISAFLLFQIQPMIGKYIAPWFGGSPTVWSTALLFFQALLTGGYAYAYWLLGRLRDRWQGIIHLIMLAVSLGLLVFAGLSWPSPLTPDVSWRPEIGGLPIWDILRILAISVGFPYLLLSSNSTLMQAWYNRDQHAKTPYRLYALSNAGSLLGLISYPILFEPNLTLRAQAYLWTGVYLLFAISAGYLALRTLRRGSMHEAPGSTEVKVSEGSRPRIGRLLLWIGLAACATTLLISVTSQITQEVAVVPFLWIIPLTIYLFTFILAFSGNRWYSRPVYLIAFFVVLLLTQMLLELPISSLGVQVFIYSLVLFIACMLCHNELYTLRPDPRFLPAYYLMIALGGALGGIFVTLVAPYLFSSGFWELQWGLVACAILLTIILQSERVASKRKSRRRTRRGRSKSAKPGTTAPRPLRPIVVAMLAGIVVLSAFTIYSMISIESDTVMARRNFYGVLRVWENNADNDELRSYQLTHGKTAHGFQFEADELKDFPTTYYAESSGVGLTLLNHPARPGNLRVGGLGLGIGVIATYGVPGDEFRFYEINPDVIAFAEGEGGYFSFLSDSQAEVLVIEGDARISLESELENDGGHTFDLLVLDAFSGDTMPLHLLTREAFEIYLEHLHQDGIIAINASNRYFNLHLELYRLADEFGLSTALIQDRGDAIQSYDSIWMLLARDPGFFSLPAIANRSSPRPPVPPSIRVWTDDFSNLLRILR